MIGINFISGIFDGAGYITLTSMVADCVEYGEWQTGKRSEGMIFSLKLYLKVKFLVQLVVHYVDIY